MPPDQILLKNFDTVLKKTDEKLNQFEKELNHNRVAWATQGASIRQGTWTKDQIDDLRILFDAVDNLRSAVAEMAARVRDD